MGFRFMDEGPSPTSTMMNTSGGAWLFGHSSFGSIHDAALGPPPNPPTGHGNGSGHGHGQSVSPFSSSPSAFDDRMSFSQNVSPTDISMAFDGSKHYVTSSSPHTHHQVCHSTDTLPMLRYFTYYTYIDGMMSRHIPN